MTNATAEYLAQRALAIRRDNNACQDCGVHLPDNRRRRMHHLKGATSQPVGDLSDLVLLCCSCHALRHQKQHPQPLMTGCAWQAKLITLLESHEYHCAGGTRALANAIGVTRVAIYRWRMGTGIPTHANQRIIARLSTRKGRNGGPENS